MKTAVKTQVKQPADLLRQTKKTLIEDNYETIAKAYQSLLKENNALKKELALREGQLRLAKLQKFGSNSEKSTFQIDFFDEAELEEALSDLESQLPDEHQPKKKARKKRQCLSAKLPRVRVELTLTEEEKKGAINTFFTKVKEELDIIPARAQVIEYWQEKAVFGEEIGKTKMISAQRPIHPLGKSIDSMALLAYIIVSKYVDSLPLY